MLYQLLFYLALNRAGVLGQNTAKVSLRYRLAWPSCKDPTVRNDVSRTSPEVLLTVVDRESTSIALVLFRCIVVVEQHAQTAFWSLIWANLSDNGTFRKMMWYFLDQLMYLYTHIPNLAVIGYLYSILVWLIATNDIIKLSIIKE